MQVQLTFMITLRHIL